MGDEHGPLTTGPARRSSAGFTRLGVHLVACALVPVMTVQSWPAPETPPAPRLEPPVIWKVSGRGWGTPVVDETSVYVLSADRQLAALERMSGRRRWTTAIDDAGGRTQASKVGIAGTVVITGDGDAILGFDAGTGLRLWDRRRADVKHAGAYLGSVSKDLVVAGSSTGQLMAVEPRDGSIRWTRVIAAGATVFSPVAHGRFVYATYVSRDGQPDAGLVQLDARDGSLRWKASLTLDRHSWSAPMVPGVPALSDTHAFVSDAAGVIRAIEGDSGQVVWRSPPGLPTESSRVDFRALTACGPKLFSGSLSGAVTRLDRASGREVWKNDAHRSSVAFGLACDEHYVYVPLVSGRLVGLEVATGRDAWVIGEGGAGFEWPVTTSGGRAYAAGSGGYVALGKAYPRRR